MLVGLIITMVKVTQLVLPLLAVGSSSAFTPSAFAPTRTSFCRPTTSLSMADETPGGKLVPIKEETVEFTAGLLGGAAGFLIGGPVLGAVGAAAANYASKSDNDIGTAAKGVSKASIEVYNYLATLDSKYEILNKAKASLESALDKLKSGDNANPETIEKVEKALSQTTSKLKEINDEYDLVGAAATALGICGDLVEKGVKKIGELNSEYKLSEKGLDAVKGAVDKSKKVASEAAEKATEAASTPSAPSP